MDILTTTWNRNGISSIVIHDQYNNALEHCRKMDLSSCLLFHVEDLDVDSIPEWITCTTLICKWSNLPSYTPTSTITTLDLSGNRLTTIYTSMMHSIVTLNLSNNRLTEIPYLSYTLQSINLSDNKITGTIPDMNDMDFLQYLNLASNQLEGCIPDDLFELNYLHTLFLDDNRLTGCIPESIEDCMSLYKLILGDNRLSGRVPSLEGYSLLILGGNQFEGDVPDDVIT